MPIIDEQFTKSRQSVHLTRVLETPNGDKLRTRIRRDSYDFQSSATIELWTPAAGWVEVAHRLGDHPSMAALPSYAADQGASRVALGNIADELETLALAIIA